MSHNPNIVPTPTGTKIRYSTTRRLTLKPDVLLRIALGAACTFLLWVLIVTTLNPAP